MPEAHEQLQELHEHAEHAQHESSLASVSLTMALLAVLVAVVGLLGHRTHTEEILLQTKASDQWGYYNSRSVRRDIDAVKLDLLSVLTVRDPEKADKEREEAQASVEHERERGTEIQNEVRKMESELTVLERRADRFDFGEGLLEAALVITSITLLTRKRGFWFVGSIVAVAGLVVAASAWVIHL